MRFDNTMTVSVDNMNPKTKVKEAWLVTLYYTDRVVRATFNGYKQLDVAVAVSSAVEEGKVIRNIALVKEDEVQLVIPTTGVSYYTLQAATYNLSEDEFLIKLDEMRASPLIDEVKEEFAEQEKQSKHLKDIIDKLKAPTSPFLPHGPAPCWPPAQPPMWPSPINPFSPYGPIWAPIPPVTSAPANLQ